MLRDSEMKILLSALNSSYTHFALALPYLKTYLEVHSKHHSVKIEEFTTEDKPGSVLSSIYSEKPDVVGFSCYIWSISKILQICENLKKVLPETKIVLGGPEVSYTAEDILKANPSIDFIVSGDGEKAFSDLIDTLERSNTPTKIPGLYYRRGEDIDFTPAVELELDSIPSPFKHNNIPYEKNVIHYETTRGCLYKCAFCTSSRDSGIREFSIDRVKDDLSILADKKVPYINILDRSFTYNEDRSIELMSFMRDKLPKTMFHFEVNPNLISDKFITFLKTLNWKQFQFEMGIQSINDSVLNNIKRGEFSDKISKNLSRIKSTNRVSLYLDIIAALPGEDLKNFLNSFEYIVNFLPEIIQIEILKMLPGTPIRETANMKNYRFDALPPYLTLSSDKMNFEEILYVEKLKEVVDKIYNKKWLKRTFFYLRSYFFKSYTEMFSSIIEFWEREGLFNQKLSSLKTLRSFENYLKYYFNSYRPHKPHEEKLLSSIFSFEASLLLKTLSDSDISYKMEGTKSLMSEDKLKPILGDHYHPIYLKKFFKYLCFYNFDFDLEEVDSFKFPLSDKTTSVLVAHPIPKVRGPHSKYFKI